MISRMAFYSSISTLFRLSVYYNGHIKKNRTWILMSSPFVNRPNMTTRISTEADQTANSSRPLRSNRFFYERTIRRLSLRPNDLRNHWLSLQHIAFCSTLRFCLNDCFFFAWHRLTLFFLLFCTVLVSLFSTHLRCCWFHDLNNALQLICLSLSVNALGTP